MYIISFIYCYSEFSTALQCISQPNMKASHLNIHEDQHALEATFFKHAVIASGELQVGRAGQKKKARMARTRSDFLTRAPTLSVGGDSDEEDYDGDSPLSPRHFTLPLSKQSSTEVGLGESCLSDSDMVTGASASHQRGSSSDTANPLHRESTPPRHASDSQ